MSKTKAKPSGLSTWLAIIILARYFAGRDLDGKRRTNATWTQHADRDLTTHGRAGRWAYKRHAERAAWRTGALLAALGTLYGLAAARSVTLESVTAGLGLGAAIAAWRVTLAILRARHNRRVVRPMFRAVAPLTNLPPGDDPSRYLSVPRNYRSNPAAKIRLALNPAWQCSVAQQKAVSGVIAQRLTGDWDAAYNMHMHPAHALFTRAPEPPRYLPLTDFGPVIAGLPENILALGRGAHGNVISFDLDSESPHLGLSMGTGGGKSDTVALIIAALVRKGCEHISIIDPKRVSHNWARGLPGVFIHRWAESQMNAIRDTRAAMDARYQALETNDEIVFPRRVLIIEETNSLIFDLEQYWSDYRAGLSSEERGKVPKRCPAITDLRYILNKGRQVRVNVISVFQRMSAGAAGGGDARENYGAKVIARCSPQTWRILYGPGTVPSAARSRIPGRAVFVLGEETHVVQRAYAGIARPDGSADRDGIARLRAFALNGRPDNGAQPAVALTAPEPAAAGTEPERLSLREACASGVLSLRYAAARKAKERDAEFPQPDGHGLYQPADLAAWASNRVRARAAA